MTNEENGPYTMTRQELLDIIEDLPDNAKIYFGYGDLSFHRVKSRGNDFYQLEFDQIYEITE